MCVDEIEGRKEYPASCTTPVEPGMQIRTQTEQVAPSIHRSKWQQEFDERAKSQGKILETV